MIRLFYIIENSKLQINTDEIFFVQKSDGQGQERVSFIAGEAETSFEQIRI